MAEGPPQTLADRDKTAVRIRYELPPGVAPPPGLGERVSGGTVEFTPDDFTQALYRLSGWAVAQGIRLDGLEVIRPSLEDVYLGLTSPGPEGGGPGGPGGPPPVGPPPGGAPPAGTQPGGRR